MAAASQQRMLLGPGSIAVKPLHPTMMPSTHTVGPYTVCVIQLAASYTRKHVLVEVALNKAQVIKLCPRYAGHTAWHALQDNVSDDMVGLSGRLLANVRAMQGAVQSREGLLNQAEAAQDVSATNAQYAVKTSKNIKNRCPIILLHVSVAK